MSAEFQSKEEGVGKRRRHSILIMLISFAICFGVFARIAHIESKALWRDEAATEVYISGNESSTQLEGHLTRNEVLNKLVPPAGTSPVEVVRLLANTAAEQVPLYYVIERMWCDVAGHSRAAIRVPCVFFGVLAIGAAYLLGAELFTSALAGGFTAAAVALSPMQIDFSLEARPYSLWSALMFTTSYLLLRALKKKTPLSWIAFGISLTACEYTQTFSILYVATLALWVLLQKRFDRGLTVSFAVAVVAVLPWLELVGTHGTRSHWLDAPKQTVSSLMTAVGRIFSHSVLGFQISDADAGILIAGVLVMFAAALAVLIKRTQKREWSLVALLISVPSVGLIVYSLRSHIGIAGVARYHIPELVGLAALIGGATNACLQIQNRAFKTLLGCAMISVFTAELASTIIFSKNPIWREKSPVSIANEINKDEAPLLVTDMTPLDAIVMAHLLRADASFYLKPDPNAALPANLPDKYWLIEQTSNQMKANYVDRTAP